MPTAAAGQAQRLLPCPAAARQLRQRRHAPAPSRPRLFITAGCGAAQRWPSARWKCKAGGRAYERTWACAPPCAQQTCHGSPPPGMLESVRCWAWSEPVCRAGASSGCAHTPDYIEQGAGRGAGRLRPASLPTQVQPWHGPTSAPCACQAQFGMLRGLAQASSSRAAQGPNASPGT